MKEQSLQEFAENLRVRGDWRQAEFAMEILDLLALEEEVAEPYSDLCADLAWHKPTDVDETPLKTVERLGDRSNMLDDIETQLKAAGLDGDPADRVKELLVTMSEAEDILEAAGWPGDGDFLDGIQALADRPKPMEFDL